MSTSAQHWVARWQRVSSLVTPDPFPPDHPQYEKILQLLNALEYHYGNQNGQQVRTRNTCAFDSTLAVLEALCRSSEPHATPCSSLSTPPSSTSITPSCQ